MTSTPAEPGTPAEPREPGRPATMRAWVADPGRHTLTLQDRPVPVPAPDEVVIAVIACGVCRTDLHVLDGDIAPHRDDVVPGHQVVGAVVEVGAQVRLLRVGDVVGAAWLRRTCGVCSWCRSGRENLCPDSLYTGWDVDGGLAERMSVPEAFAYLLPVDTDPVATAPLLCAGIIGFRALSRAALPPGGTLGLYGFGSSAHIAAQLAMAAGAEVCAITRGERNRDLARAMGLSFVGEEGDEPPVPLDSAIVFAPAGETVPQALHATIAGGTVVVAGIHLSDVPKMSYERALFHERDLRSVTANTRADGETFLRLARHLELRPAVTTYPFERVDAALEDLRSGRSSGSLVITVR